MSRPLASSIFLALITGGMKAPRDGKPNTTIDTFDGACAAAGAGDSHVARERAAAAKAVFSKRDRLVIESSVIFSGSRLAAFLLNVEQFLREAAVDGHDLRRGQAGGIDDLGWLVIADRERHIRPQQELFGADHFDDELQNARIMHDGVGVERSEPRNRVADAGGDRMVLLQAAEHEGQAGAADGRENLGVLVLGNMAG